MFNLIIVATIIGVLYVFYSNKMESFTSNLITFLDANDTKRFLIEDDDRYITSMSYSDLLARKISNHRQYLEVASGSALHFNEMHKVILEDAVLIAEKELQVLNHPWIRYQTIPWKFALVHPNYENGLPHTRADIIFLYPQHLDLTQRDLVNLLIHEWIHLYQRLHKNRLQVLLEQNGYMRWKLRKSIPLIRANPDVDEFIYLHPSGEVMQAVYNSSYPKSISDVSSTQFSMEHPFEEMAYTITANLKRA